MELYNILFLKGDASGFFQHTYLEIHPFRWEDQSFISLLLSNVPLYGLNWVPLQFTHGSSNPQCDHVWRQGFEGVTKTH